jgi:hypothetical protein
MNSPKTFCRWIAIISFNLLLFGSLLWSQTAKQYTYENGRLIAVETTCAYILSPPSASVPVGGATGLTVNITCNSSCSWIASSNAAWITVTAGGSGTGNGTVRYSISANTGSERIGTITIGSQTFTITQEGICTYSISPGVNNIEYGGGTGTVSVDCIRSNCPWTASSNAAWITVTAGGSGTGDGTVAYSVAGNSGSARTGTITIAGQTFTINQTGSPIRIGITGYLTLQAAYNAATNGATIQCQNVQFIENLLVNRNISITLQGGYNSDFTATNGNMSEIKGLIITNAGGGTLTIRNFILANQ